MSKRLGDAIELRGFDLQRSDPKPGASVPRLTLHWQAIAVPAEDYTVFVQLLDGDGRPVAQADSEPAAGRWPTSYWESGDRITDTHELKLDQGLPPGRYSIVAGMYLAATGQRLVAEDGQDYIRLGEVSIGP